MRLVLPLAGLLVLASARAQESAERTHVLAGFGSSVCNGFGDRLGEGYIGMLDKLLQARGWEVLNVSRGGDNTATILERWEKTDREPSRPVAPDRYLLPHQPDYVLIGLSLANEGLRMVDAADREMVFEQFRTGLLDLIERCRSEGFGVVVANCYPNDYYEPAHYAFIQRMNALIHSWDVASINVLGAVNDGAGRWVEGFTRDPGHPSRAGHREMFHAIPPTLFDALVAGKKPPVMSSEPGFVRIESGAFPALEYATVDSMHSFALGAWVRVSGDGVLFAATGKSIDERAVTVEFMNLQGQTFQAQTVELDEMSPAVELSLQVVDSRLVLVDVQGERHTLAAELETGWHHVLLSHQTARGQTWVYLDGIDTGSVTGRIATRRIGIGTAGTDLRDLVVYRSMLTPGEVRTLQSGELLRSSLDVYAPLRDTDTSRGTALSNTAQSLAELRVLHDGVLSLER